MHPYLKHLLNDISAAERTELPFEETMPPLTFEEEMEELESWVEGHEGNHTFGYYCGLDTVNFPPPHQLTNNEMKMVIKAFEQMMFTWNQGISLPEVLPLPIAYKMTIETLNTKTNIVNNGMMSFDFCTGYAPDCVFKEYCPCLEIWNNDDGDIDMDIDVNELPF